MPGTSRGPRLLSAIAVAWLAVAALATPAAAHEGEESVPALTQVQVAVAILRTQPELVDLAADRINDATEAEDKDGVDIDREMIRLGQRFLGLREDPRLRIFIEDGRAFLLRGPRTRYDVLVVDLFQGGVFVPYYTLTREFFELGRDRLNEGGVLAIFVARPRPFDSPLRREKFDRLFKSIGNTLAAVFPSVFFYSVSEIGYYFVATTEPTSLEAVRARLGRVAIPEITEPLGAAVKRIREYEPDPRIRVLTDDLAPVDQLIYDAFFRH